MTTFRSLWLIAASLALLAVFEGLWLRQVWKEQYEGLQQETDYVFQGTVAALQDSLVRRSMAKNHVPVDSSTMFPRVGGLWNKRVLPPNGQGLLHLETQAKMIVRMESEEHRDLLRPDTGQYDKVQVFVTSTPDGRPPGPGTGVDRLLIDLPQHLRRIGKEGQVFQIEKDSLPLAELEAAYRKKLLETGIALPFRIVQADSLPVFLSVGGITTQPAFAGLLQPRIYAANFPEYGSFLLRKMLASGAFALLLFGLTATAFALIYRGLRQQQRLTRLKNEFISNVTHELKTPITTVAVALEALSDFEALRDPARTREYLTLSKLELDRLSLLVDKVLRLSMFEQQEHRLQAEPLDLAALVRQVIAALTLQAERLGATIRFDAPEGEAFNISGDRLHLSSVVFNLLDNALKYGGEHPEILVLLEKTPAWVRLRVRDKGIGIPPEYQSRIFDKFFRVPTGDRHDVKGHGLGLNYVAQVLRQHGGSIRVESEPGAGSEFVVELPLVV